jgi:nitroreductase
MSIETNDTLMFLRRLRAAKEYTAEPVSQEQIEAILEVGRWSGSGANRQPTEVVVVRDPAVRKQLGQWGAEPAGKAPVVLLLVVKNDGSALDEGRVAERLCLAAAACGLGSTVATLKEEGPTAVKTLLAIPTEHRARVLVALGHTDVAKQRARPKHAQARKPMSEFAHWDRY